MARLADRIGRVRYAAAQSARVAWYTGHYLAARRLSRPFDRPGEPRFRPQSAPGDQRRIRSAFLSLFAKDRANIEEGLYPAPEDLRFDRLVAGLSHSAAFFKDLPEVDARRWEKRGVEVRAEAPAGRYPTYYLQNFHYQSGGWLSEDSAELYDTQVEVLFGGAADAMRRIALGELARALRGKDQRKTKMLDVACGNGRFLEQTLGAFPRLKATGLDLSPAYLARARDRLRAYPQVEFVAGQAERMPFDADAFSAATCIFLFHELPPRVRPLVAQEIARVLAPGSGLVLADSLQLGDAPDLDQMLEYFPHGFHEPYYGSYLKEDLIALFEAVGFRHERTELAFLTKVLRFRRA
jgi:ubiquinone/menaquinone biosynthesis C-methylase UbiE